jgi:hypothetical protein
MVIKTNSIPRIQRGPRDFYLYPPKHSWFDFKSLKIVDINYLYNNYITISKYPIIGSFKWLTLHLSIVHIQCSDIYMYPTKNVSL